MTLERFFVDLHGRVRDGLETLDGSTPFLRDRWQQSQESGIEGQGESAILEGGEVFERAAVMLSVVSGAALPPAATQRRPQAVGKPYRAVGVSVVVHPRNPYVPTSHFNVRCFETLDGNGRWFGGGFDLTPHYPFLDDARSWHRAAKTACDPFGADLYATFKRQCDDYFYLKHRRETRGVGGLFFDDLAETALAGRAFALTQSIAAAYLPAYSEIVRRRMALPYTERERDHQLVRRGRYVEFNLLYDRGTLFGIQSQGRPEAVLASMPPLVSWRYRLTPSQGSPEAELAEYLTPRDWL